MKKIMMYCLLACGIILGTISIGNMVSEEGEKEVYTSNMSMNKEFPTPKLIAAKQISSNQIEITYDRDVDTKLATKPMNYWVQSTINEKINGITTLGKDDKVLPENSLTDDKVKIEPVDGSKRVFTLTFNNDIIKDEEFKIIIYNVTVPGAPANNSDNGTVVLVGK